MPRDQRWQATMWLDEKPVTVYGPTLKGLRQNAEQELLRAQRPLMRFENSDPKKYVLSPVGYYLFLWFEGGMPIPQDVRDFLKARDVREPNPDKQPGWHLLYSDGSGMRMLDKPTDYFGEMGAAAEYFVQAALVPEKGPEYIDEFSSLGHLPLHRMQSVKRVIGEGRAQDMISRGWYILSIEPRGEVSAPEGEVLHATPAFTVGHPEPDAV